MMIGGSHMVLKFLPPMQVLGDASQQEETGIFTHKYMGGEREREM